MAALKKERQGLLEDMLDPETVARMNEQQDGDAFQVVDTIAPEYSCPRCGYGWRGNPRPPSGVQIEEDADGDA